MNVLVTSSGRRVSLLKAFQNAISYRNGKVCAGDVDSIAPALYYADEFFQLPKVSAPNFIDYLLDIVIKYEIQLIIPTIDTELKIYANNKNYFKENGCNLLISDINLVEICQDKWKTVNVFQDYGIRTPKSWLPEMIEGRNLTEELFIKPRNGSSSQHTNKVTNREQLSKFIAVVPYPIIQEYLPYAEITIDALISFTGEVIHYVPRRRIRTIGGESVQGVTISDNGITEWILNVLRVISELGGRGPITLQAFLAPEGPVLSEVNPRFGGGVPLTFAAGGAYPEWILRMLEGENIVPKIGEYKKNLYMSRHYNEVIVEQPFWEVNL